MLWLSIWNCTLHSYHTQHKVRCDTLWLPTNHIQKNIDIKTHKEVIGVLEIFFTLSMTKFSLELFEIKVFVTLSKPLYCYYEVLLSLLIFVFVYTSSYRTFYILAHRILIFDPNDGFFVDCLNKTFNEHYNQMLKHMMWVCKDAYCTQQVSLLHNMLENMLQ